MAHTACALAGQTDPVWFATARIGKGGGPLSAELKSKPSDLSTLAKNNNGVFPVEAMYKVIDARKSITAHGSREMPICRAAFLSFGPDSQLIVRNRILAVVDYLSRIQVK